MLTMSVMGERASEREWGGTFSLTDLAAGERGRALQLHMFSGTRERVGGTFDQGVSVSLTCNFMLSDIAFYILWSTVRFTSLCYYFHARILPNCPLELLCGARSSWEGVRSRK